MKTLRTLIRFSACAGISFTLAGCLTTTPVWDAHFGEAVRQITAAQVLNPQAENNEDPVSGIDGRAAAASMYRYNKSFIQPPHVVNPYVIGVGSGASGGSP
jgi:hypothetical protein